MFINFNHSTKFPLMSFLNKLMSTFAIITFRLFHIYLVQSSCWENIYLGHKQQPFIHVASFSQCNIKNHKGLAPHHMKNIPPQHMFTTSPCDCPQKSQNISPTSNKNKVLAGITLFTYSLPYQPLLLKEGFYQIKIVASQGYTLYLGI